MKLPRLFGTGPAAEFPPLQPESPVEIVGDVHGCADLLAALPPPSHGCPRIYVGDVVDRGPDSRGVLRRLQALEAAGHGTCLMGNHEAMLLEFLDDPMEGRCWLRHGGIETLASYGVPHDRSAANVETLTALRDRFRAMLGPATEHWLRDRPRMWRSGNLVVTHAGADPARPIDNQPPRALLWGSRDFAQGRRRSDGIWIAHGHTIVDAPEAAHGRIAVDTGAYARGRLTMARIEPDGSTRFQTITGP